MAKKSKQKGGGRKAPANTAIINELRKQQYLLRRRAFIPLPTTLLERQKRPRLNHKIGTNLPIHLGDVKPCVAEQPNELLHAVRNNGMALLSYLTKLIGKRTHDPHYEDSSSNVRVITVMTSDLIPYAGELTTILNVNNIQKITKHAAFGLSRAFLLCRKFGYRLVWINDIAISEASLHLLRSIYHAAVPVAYHSRNAVFKVALYHSDILRHFGKLGKDYHILLDLNVFQVINDVARSSEELSNYLSYCLTNQVAYLQKVEMTPKVVKWLTKEKRRLWLAQSPLIIIERQFKLTRKNIDAECRYYLPICRHSDVLLWRP